MVLRERPGSLFLGCSGILWDNHRVPYGVVSVGESLCRRDTPLPLLGAGSGVSVQAVIILRTVSFPAPKGVEVEGSKSNSLLFFFFFNLVTRFRESGWSLGSQGIQVPFFLCRLFIQIRFPGLDYWEG